MDGYTPVSNHMKYISRKQSTHNKADVNANGNMLMKYGA
jgi:hypothetical protein